MNQELKMSTYFHDGVELTFSNAENNWHIQEQQVDSLVKAKVDLLVLSPVASKELVPAVDRAMAAGIPVLIFDRELDSDNYTAFIGANNEDIGNEMGKFIVSHSGGKGNIVEISGQSLCSPTFQRHIGFLKAVKSHPDIHVTSSLPSTWTEESGYIAMDSVIKTGVTSIDYVYAHNDRLAMGAYKALLEHKLLDSVKICGIDGLPGPGGGIDQVDKGVMLATCLYPTKGNIIMQLALNILEGKPYQKQNSLKSALVTKENTSIWILQNEALNEEQNQMELLNDKLIKNLNHASKEKIIFFNIILLLVCLCVILFYHIRVSRLKESRQTLNRMMILDTVDSINRADSDSNSTSSDESESASEPVTDSCQGTVENNLSPTVNDAFANNLRKVIMQNYSNSDFNVDSLANELNLSRAQLYRKVKNLSGQSPVELLRDIRLQQAVHLLSTTDKTVSEIAYSVGFSAPAYFSKCYKDRYGQTPRENK